MATVTIKGRGDRWSSQWSRTLVVTVVAKSTAAAWRVMVIMRSGGTLREGRQGRFSERELDENDENRRNELSKQGLRGVGVPSRH